MRWRKRRIKEEIKRNGETKEGESENIRVRGEGKEEGGVYAVPEASRSDMPRGRDRQGQPLPASYMYMLLLLAACALCSLLRLFIYL